MNAYAAWTHHDWVRHYAGAHGGGVSTAMQLPAAWELDAYRRRERHGHSAVRFPLGATHGNRFAVGAIVTPGDVLAYRQTWDGYVMGIARLLDACADGWDAAAQNPSVKDPNLDYSWLEDPTNAKAMSAKANYLRACVNTITTRWNLFAGYTDMQIVLMGGDILKSFQETVLKAGQEYVPVLKSGCPHAAIPPAPSVDVQAQVIGRIEGLGILARGILQMLAVAADGALQTLGAIPRYIDKHLPKDPLGTIEGILIAGAVVLGLWVGAPLLRGVGGAAGSIAQGKAA